jgi:hypothetical protein
VGEREEKGEGRERTMQRGKGGQLPNASQLIYIYIYIYIHFTFLLSFKLKIRDKISH